MECGCQEVVVTSGSLGLPWCPYQGGRPLWARRAAHRALGKLPGLGRRLPSCSPRSQAYLSGNPSSMRSLWGWGTQRPATHSGAEGVSALGNLLGGRGAGVVWGLGTPGALGQPPRVGLTCGQRQTYPQDRSSLTPRQGWVRLCSHLPICPSAHLTFLHLLGLTSTATPSFA